MARYTMNLSEICEEMSGVYFNDQTGNAFDRVDTIANAAAPLIFSDRYDLFDNGDDRNDLWRMILEHYWEYEVCAQTPSDFVLRINRKLNEIAPLYNQRYESTKMEFPVFQDVNYWADGQHDQTFNQHDVHDDTTTNSGTDTTGFGKMIDADTDGMTASGEMVGDSENWQYNNDTPQGSISGITDQDYLTDYHKQTGHVQHDQNIVPTGYNGNSITGRQYNIGQGPDGTFVEFRGSTSGDYGRTQQISGSKESGEETFTHGKVTDFDGDLTRDTATHDTDGKHLYGKQNMNRTYAEMMNSYRKAMINIYNEVIEELKELFFIIY